ncbi:caffeoylshikimate esterase-like [Silene latifolia]|uniref:caffeoylshikimate esterase-like n=1 Tax=Silene latifolia TaxID=37657 RepID=UPI003D783CAD
MVFNVKFEEEYIISDKGLKLFTCRWLPENQEQKALVFLCHGYAMESSISMKGTANRLANAGYGVYGIDYVGHGKSEGLHGYIPKFDDLIRDCADHFAKVCERQENKGHKRFMLGESMGGAVVLLLHRKMPEFWNGVVLVAPMCKIAEELKPNELVIKVLEKLANVLPTWKIVPGQDIVDVAVRDPAKKEEVRSNPYWYTDRPRLRTASELLNASMGLEDRLNEVTVPFIIVHGGDDKVTDPSISKMLYDTALSTDKTFKLYPGMWHALTYGELPENINIVFKDIIEWLDERSPRNSMILEQERKSKEDIDANIQKRVSLQCQSESG